MRIENHILKPEENDKFPVSNQRALDYIANRMDRDSGKLSKPDTILVHYTGTLNAEGDIRTLYESDTQVSVHFVVDLKGEIIQLMPLDRIAWHAGESHYQGRLGFNKYSIGIEMVNPGFLERASNGDFYTWYNQPVQADKAVLLKHKNEQSERYWHIYTPEQVQSVVELSRTIAASYPINLLLGHDDVAPTRKVDPGPAFPLTKLQNLIIGDRKEDTDPVNRKKDFGFVNVSKLNIREEGNTNAAKVAMPLDMGSKVNILDEKEGWYKVETTITGWVSAKYIRK